MSTTLSALMPSPAPAQLKRDIQVISLVGVGHGVSHFYHLILAPLFPFLKVAFNLTYPQLGWLMSVFFIVSGVGQALSGFVVDKVGAFKVLCFGMTCLMLSAIALSVAPNYPFLLLGAMLAGLGNSIFHPSDYSILNQQVSAKRLGYAYSVHGISGNIGWACAPLFLIPVATLYSWRSALCAAAILPLTMIILFVLNRNLLATTIHTHNPNAQIKTPNNSTLHFLKLPAVWLCFAFFFITSMSLGGIQSFAVESLQKVYGVTLAMATSAYSAYMFSSAMGMLLGGYLANKVTRHDYIIAAAFTVSGGICWFISTGIAPTWLLLILMGIVGFGAGIAGPSRDFMIRAATPKNATGRVYGVVYSGLDIGLAVAPILFGQLMGGNHFTSVFVFIGAFQILALTTAINVGNNTARNRVTTA